MTYDICLNFEADWSKIDLRGASFTERENLLVLFFKKARIHLIKLIFSSYLLLHYPFNLTTANLVL